MRAWIAGRARALSIVVTLVVVAAIAVFAVFAGNTKMKQVTVYFPSTIGIYQGTSVRLLGVEIGKVDAVDPQGTSVKVSLSYDASVKVPANTGVAQIPPSIVSDRYLQFDKTYRSGPELADHATITADRTEVPVELDQIFGSLNNLNIALGPNGANKSGALSQLIDVGAANLRGNGEQFNATLKGFSQAVNTLANSRDALFGTITSLQKFTTTIATDDAGVRTVNGQLAQVSAQLAGERQDLGAALANLASALTQVQSFVASNKDTLTHDIAGLTTVTSGLVSQQQAIKEILNEAPVALYNLVLSFNRSVQTCGNDGSCSYGALTTRADNTSSQGDLLCSVLSSGLSNLPSNPVTGLTPSVCAQLVAQSAPTPSTGQGVKAPVVPPVALPSVPSGLVGGLLNGLGQALGGSGGAGPSSGPGVPGAPGGASTPPPCTGVLCGILGGGAG